MVNNLNKSVFIKRKGVYHKILLDDIIYLEANGDYVSCQLVEDEKFVFRSTLKDALKLLPSDRFIRTHRSYAIQLPHITGIDFQEGCVYLGEYSVPANRDSRKVLNDLITRLD